MVGEEYVPEHPTELAGGYSGADAILAEYEAAEKRKEKEELLKAARTVLRAAKRAEKARTD